MTIVEEIKKLKEEKDAVIDAYKNNEFNNHGWY